MSKFDNMSPAALAAAMKGGTEAWGTWGSIREHIVYVEPAPGRRREKCRCGCGGRVTHRASANGLCMASGCELSMHRFAKNASAA